MIAASLDNSLTSDSLDAYLDLFDSEFDEDSPWWESDISDDEVDDDDRAPEPISEVTSFASTDDDLVCRGGSPLTPSWWHEPSSSNPDCLQDAQPHTQRACDPNDKGDEPLDSGHSRTAESLEDVQERATRNRECQSPSPDVESLPLLKISPEPIQDHIDLSSTIRDLQEGIHDSLAVFLLMFNIHVVNNICKATNTNAWEAILADVTLSTMEDGSWQEITTREMYAFIAVVLIMRLHPKVAVSAFWRRGRRTEPWPWMLMQRRRFAAILKVLKFTNKEDTASSEKIEEDSFNSPVPSVPRPTNGYLTHPYVDNYTSMLLSGQTQTIIELLTKRYECLRVEMIACVGGLQTKEVALNCTRISYSGENAPSKNIKETSLESIFHPPHKRTLLGSKGNSISQEPPPKRTKLTCRYSSPQVKVLLCQGGQLGVSVQHNQFNDLSVPQIRDLLLNSKTPDKTSNRWNEVFIPDCKMLTHRQFKSRKKLDRTCEEILHQCFFYHYFHLALFFSAQNSKKTSCEFDMILNEPNDLDRDAFEKILHGLVELGEPNSEPETLDEDLTSSDNSSETSDEETRPVIRPHGYITTRTSTPTQCALCWLLRQEVRRVQTRCARCEKHFCLSHFRNCMKEAHANTDIFKT